MPSLSVLVSVATNKCPRKEYFNGKMLKRESKLIGMSFNCRPRIRHKHLQSMVMATDRIGMDVLLDKGPLGKCNMNWTEAVNSEAAITDAIFGAGYKVIQLFHYF